MRSFYLFYLVGFFVLVSQAEAQTGRYTSELQKAGKLGINADECSGIEAKLGQLLYANVDNFGTPGKDALDPAYIKMVEDLQLGGVLPKTRLTDQSKIAEVHKKLQEVSRQPLMIGVDKMILETSEFGLGYGSGLLNQKAPNISDACLKREVFLDAFLHRVSGVNHALGPTVERAEDGKFLSRDISEVAPKARDLIEIFHKGGIATTNKHYPYTPTTYNLHDKTVDDKISKAAVNRKLEPFRELASESDFLMTTHVLNSNIDKENVVTFSPEWIRILREEVKYDGLIMTDGIFMFNQYPESIKKMAAKWPQDQVPLASEHAIFAARAILAGHDMVIVESIAADTYKIFKELLYLACQNKPIGDKFRARVNESHKRIVAYKKKHNKELRFSDPVPADLYEEANEIYIDANYRSPGSLCQHSKFEAWKKKAEIYMSSSMSKESATKENSIESEVRAGVH